MTLRFLGAVALVALVACGSGSGGGTGNVDAGEGGEEASGQAGASPVSGGEQGSSGESSAGGTGEMNAAGVNGEAGAAATLPPKICDASMPFGAPQPLMELDTSNHEAGPRLTSDELTIAYLCRDGDTTSVCIAQRADMTADFEPLLVAVESDGGVPWLSDDTLALFYEDDASLGLFFSERAGSDQPFPLGRELTELAGFGDPYVIGGRNGRLYLSRIASTDLYVTPLNDWLPGEPQLLPGGSTDEYPVRPVLTPDELTLYYGASGEAASLDIYVKQRSSKSEPFGDPVTVSELNDSADQFPGFISTDGCRLYFDAGETTRDLYVAEREH